MIKQFSKVEELQNWRAEQAGLKIAFVPTMGALHQGHLSLIKEASALADIVIVSIFVNPTQFAPTEDFGSYPRSLALDIASLEPLGVACVFTPEAKEIYPESFQTYIDNPLLGKVLCGAARPIFFRGVLTVLLKLFNLIRPNFVVMGKKDYQQFRIVERMVKDLHLDITVVGSPLVRDLDGLALSSRNKYLDHQNRKEALHLSKGLLAAKQAFEGGERVLEKLLLVAENEIKKSSAIKIDYLQIVNKFSLDNEPAKVSEEAVFLAAVNIGNVRLIDNCEL